MYKNSYLLVLCIPIFWNSNSPWFRSLSYWFMDKNWLTITPIIFGCYFTSVDFRWILTNTDLFFERSFQKEKNKPFKNWSVAFQCFIIVSITVSKRICKTIPLSPVIIRARRWVFKICFYLNHLGFIWQNVIIFNYIF